MNRKRDIALVVAMFVCLLIAGLGVVIVAARLIDWLTK